MSKKQRQRALTRRSFLAATGQVRALAGLGRFILASFIAIAQTPALIKDKEGRPLRAATSMTAAPAARTGTAGRELTLFAFDDHSLPFRRNTYLTLMSAEKHPQNPVLRRGAAGAPDDARAHFHGTVLRVDGKFRMWYVAVDEESLQSFGKSVEKGVWSRVAYAESEDGIRWHKPNLGLVEYRGSKANNLIDLEGPALWPSVLYEPGEPDPGKRYKMMFKSTGGRLPGILDRYPDQLKAAHGVRVSPLCAYSADGLRWRLADHNPPLMGNMEGANFYKFGGHYFVQGHIYGAWAKTTGMLLNGDPTGRVLFTYRSPDFVHWTQGPAISFARHGYRAVDPGAVEEAHTATGAWDRGNVLVSPYLQWHGAKDVDSRWMDVGLLVSNDGIHFREPIPDFQLISRGEKGGWEGGSLWGVSFLNVGDRTFIYYSGLTGGGSTALGRGEIGLATLARDRFGYLALKESNEAGWLMSCLIEPGEGARIFVNADGLEADANLRFGLLDERHQPVAGYGVGESVPLATSGLRQPVAWKRGAEIRGLRGKKVYLQVELRGSGGKSPRLFAIYLAPSR